MKSLRQATAVLAATVVVGGMTWIGCGDDDDGGGGPQALFSGDVASVSGGSAAAEAPESTYATRMLSWPALAWAQSTCAAPTGNLLFCVDEFCTDVDAAGCDFSQTVSLPDAGPVSVTIRFVDDEDEDGIADDDESDSVLDQDLDVCDGDQISIQDAAINFSGGTTATVSKTIDNCGATTRTPSRTVTSGTPGPTATRTRTRTPGVGTPGAGTPGAGTPGAGTPGPGTPGPGTPGVGTPGAGTPTATRTPTGTPTGPTPTRTPTYAYGTAMTDAPIPSFAFLASLGVIGLLIPKRRKR